MTFHYTISCIIKNQKGECLTDNGWEKDYNRGVLFAPQQAEATIKVLAEKAAPGAIIAAYVIQNEKFNYHGGDSGWVTNVREAEFYVTAKEAEIKVKTL